MASYRLLIKPSAAKEVESTPLKDRRKIVLRIRALGGEPRSGVAEKLAGSDLYRVRQGAYRIIYLIDDRDRTVTIVKVGHRREVYR